PCFGLDPEPDFLPPWLEAFGEFAILAARSFDMPFSFKASYCFSFLTLALLLGIRLRSFSAETSYLMAGLPESTPNYSQGSMPGGRTVGSPRRSTSGSPRGGTVLVRCGRGRRPTATGAASVSALAVSALPS